MNTTDLLTTAGLVALWVLAVSAFGLLVLAASYTFENRRRARHEKRIETLYSARCPNDLSNMYGDDPR